MNKRIYPAFVIAVLILVSFLTAEPVRSDETADSNPILASSANLFEGMLAIKEGHGDILVRSENGDQKRFKIKDNTIITRNGKPASYDDLRARDQLRVHYDSKRVVIELHVTGS
jgi:hypothetical protein